MAFLGCSAAAFERVILMKNLFRTAALMVPLSLALAYGAQAKEIPIGKPQLLGGMEIAAVYLQPIEMEPEA